MAEDPTQHSWFGPTLSLAASQEHEGSDEFNRMWLAFMTARLTLGAAMVVLQWGLLVMGGAHNEWALGTCVLYCLSTLWTRLRARPRAPQWPTPRVWWTVVGTDSAAFLALQLLQGGSINYTPLFALPILLTAVLGSLRLALVTAASVTVLLLATALWTYLTHAHAAMEPFVQAALGGLGYFVVALVANQLSTRLANEGQRARLNLLAASLQRQVNELVIESLPDGVLIVDAQGVVRAANPAARQLLGLQHPSPSSLHASFKLQTHPAWAPLWALTQLSIGTGQGQMRDITLRPADSGAQPMRVRTRLTPPQGMTGDMLCVLFLQDLRELEARMRSEKLASMGRMSTAVAHEIRNPLAAIAQANALLGEDLQDPRFARLTQMIDQNVKRLGKIVDDVLSVTHVLPPGERLSVESVPLDATLQRTCQEWRLQQGVDSAVLMLHCEATGAHIAFEQDHLRRLMVNLLDNAWRHAPAAPGCIEVSTRCTQDQASLAVWSAGEPLDQSVERHLFEPFFSSQSRSSGLGLYLCRQLCERHGASIAYQRAVRVRDGLEQWGNAFVVTCKRSEAQWPSAHSPAIAL